MSLLVYLTIFYHITSPFNSKQSHICSLLYGMVYLTDSIHLLRHDHVLQWMKSVSFDCYFLHSRYPSMLSLLLLLFFVAGIPFIMPPPLSLGKVTT